MAGQPEAKEDEERPEGVKGGATSSQMLGDHLREAKGDGSESDEAVTGDNGSVLGQAEQQRLQMVSHLKAWEIGRLNARGGEGPDGKNRFQAERGDEGQQRSRGVFREARRREAWKAMQMPGRRLAKSSRCLP